MRSAVSIVPQSSDLFEGTLRENIDPGGQYQDADIWVALSQVSCSSSRLVHRFTLFMQAHLKEYVESLPERLEAPVREGGQSLSSGQRQLLCFTRALLRKVWFDLSLFDMLIYSILPFSRKFLCLMKVLTSLQLPSEPLIEP